MMTRLISMSIRAQILLLALIVAIPAVGIIVYAGFHTREEAIHDARMETQRLADNVAAEQQNLITAAQQLMIALAQLPEVKKRDRDRVESILRDILKLNAQYSNIFIADRKGLVWATAVPVKPPFIVFDRRYFKNALASGQLSSGEYVISRATIQPAVNIGYPLRNERGAIVSVISVGFALDAFKRVLERAKLPASASFALYDHQGIVLYRVIDPEIYVGRQIDPELFKQMQEGPDVNTYYGIMAIGGDKRVVTYRKLWLPGEQEPYLYIRAGIPVTTVLADANKVLIRNLSLFTSFLFLAILFAWLIGKRSIADRITLLEKASRNLAEGNLHVRVSDLVVGGELGRLGQTFDAMARQLSQREQALVESERNYRDIFNTTKDAIFVHDAESGNIVEINKTVEEMYGYSREEILNQQALYLSSGEPPYSSRDALDWIRKASLKGSQQFEWSAKKKNGELFWTEVVISRTQIAGAGRVLVVVRDITEKKNIQQQLEKALEDSSATTIYLNSVINAVADPIFVKDRQHRWVLLNDAYCGLKGRSRDELLGKTVYDIDPKNQADIMWQDDERVFNTGKELVREGERTDSEGIVHTTVTKKTLFKNKKGEDFIVGVVRNITERKRMEVALQVSERRLKLAAASGHLGIWDRDIESGNQIWDDRMYEIYGLAKDSFPATFEAWTKYLHPDDRERVIKESQAAVRGEKDYDTEFRILHPDGSLKYIRASGLVIRDTEGKPIRAIGINWDITEQKNLEEKLRQSQKIEVVGQLAGGIAHDFNNILTAIICYGNLINLKLPETDPMHQYIDQIIESSEKAADLTRSLLAFSRKQVINPVPVDVNRIVTDMQKILERVIGEHIEFRVKTADHALIVKSDKSQIEQVLLNLATNARDAMPNGGALTITTEEDAIDEKFIRMYRYGKVGRYVIITVTDTGEGMDKTTQEHIFEPFFTTKEVGKGTGLGLSMVYGTIKQHDGFINVYSEPGKGTTFSIYLPLTEATAQQNEDKRTTDISLGTETLLLVEDDDAVRTVIRTMIEGFGYKVIEAIDGHQAVAVFRENGDRVQLVVSDMIMPRMSGKEVYRELQKVKPGIKILYMSGYTADILEQQGVENEKINFISKPFGPDALSRKIREVLDGS
jgi:PAS domain S-box-containing protein